MYFGCEEIDGKVVHSAAKAIESRSFKVSRLDRLNDPFEWRFARITDPDLNDAVDGIRKDVASVEGILCFSSCWSHPLIWSHYAKQHEGICLGFEYTENPENPVPVDYCEERLSVDEELLSRIGLAEGARRNIEQYGEDPDVRQAIVDGEHAELEFERLCKKLALRKYIAWKYEDEVRMLVPVGDGGMPPISVPGLMRVGVGFVLP